MKEEIWKTIKDSDGHYFISNKGKMKREELWFCFNHNIKDKQNKIWDILNI